MKKVLFFFAFTLFLQNLLAQDGIKTTVITLNLSEPDSLSVQHSGNKKRLVVDNKSPLAFKLINGNPFRFRYVLNFNKINLFDDRTFDPKLEDLKKDESDAQKIDGLADQDGDGIQDSDDSCPNEAGPKITDGCAASPEEIKAKVFEKLQALHLETTKVSDEVINYRNKISTESTLDRKKFNEKIKEFKKAYIRVLELKQYTEEQFVGLDLKDVEIVEKRKEIDTQIESLRVSIEELQLKSSSTYLLPIDLNGDNIDYLEITLEVYEGEREKPTPYTYKIWIKGGVKIDVSGGVMVTSLFDNSYFTTDADNGQKVINKNDSGGYEFGFGSMVNISFRGGSWVRPAINVGAIFTSNQKFQLLSGIGFILGKNQRFIFHTGVAMGRMNELRDDLMADGTTAYDLGAEGTVPVFEKFGFGHYFGVTYNFTKVKAKLPE